MFLFAAFGGVAVGHELQDGSSTGLSCRALTGESITANLNSAAGCHLIPPETVCISSCNRLCEFKNLPLDQAVFSDERKELPNGGVKCRVCFPLGLFSKHKQIYGSEDSGSGYRREAEKRRDGKQG